jgi:hypothetical protein
MSGGLIFTTLKYEPVHVKMVYMIAEQLANCTDTMWKGKPIAKGEFITSLNHLTEYTSLSKKLVRSALARLVTLELIKTSAADRRFTRIFLSSKGTVLGTVSGTANATKKQHESIKVGTDSGTDLGTRVLGVNPVLSQSSDVGVSPGLIQEKETRARPPVNNLSQKPTALYEAAAAKAPMLPDVAMHIDRIYADLSSGHKYPWRGNPKAATILSELIVSHGAPLVIAATERFFVRGNAWIEERAWAIDEFAKQFARFITIESVTRRAAQVAQELQTQARPTTPRELRDQLAKMRRRQMGDYDPAEELREKVPVG